MESAGRNFQTIAVELIRTLGMQEARSVAVRLGFEAGHGFIPSVVGLQKIQSWKEILVAFLDRHGFNLIEVDLSLPTGNEPTRSRIEFSYDSADKMAFLMPWFCAGWCSGYSSAQLGRIFLYRVADLGAPRSAPCVFDGREETDWKSPELEPIVDYVTCGRNAIPTRSLAMRICLDRLKDVALGENSICLQMERGENPPALGRFIHYHSQRSRGPFIYLEGRSLERNLFENSLQSAAGGTIFISAIETLPLLFQRRLVDAITTMKGAGQSFRLIVSSERSLAHLLRDQRLIPDLARLLQVCEILVPTIRMRMEDLIPQARRFLEFLAPRSESQAINFSAAVLNEFLHHQWPGGSQELREVIQAMLEKRREGERLLDIRHLPTNFGAQPGGADPGFSLVGLSLAEVERRLILTTVNQVRGNKREAARVLKIGYNTLWRKLSQYEAESRRSRRQNRASAD